MMKRLRLVRDGTRLEVSVLAVMTMALGGAGVGSAAFPMSADAPRTLLLAIGLAAFSVAFALLVAAPSVSELHLHGVVVIFTVLRAVMVAVATTERGLMLSALGYTWTAVYVAFFFQPAAAWAYAALITVTLGTSLLVAHAPTDAMVWITISTMVWVAVAILTRLNSRLRAQAHTDALTGLLNRGGFELAAARQRAMSTRRGEPIALVMIDLDAFKLVNDRGGHAAGDRHLVELARAWSASLRPGDLLARFGGDEFVLLMPGVEEHRIDGLLARLAQAHRAAWTAGAVICASDETLDEAIERADARLYVARKLRAAEGHTPENPRFARSGASLQPGQA